MARVVWWKAVGKYFVGHNLANAFRGKGTNQPGPKTSVFLYAQCLVASRLVTRSSIGERIGTDKNVREIRGQTSHAASPLHGAAAVACSDTILIEHDVPTKTGGRETRVLSHTAGSHVAEGALRLLTRNDTEWEKLRLASEQRCPIHISDRCPPEQRGYSYVNSHRTDICQMYRVFFDQDE